LLDALEKITKHFPSEEVLLKTNCPDGMLLYFRIEIQDAINVYNKIAKGTTPQSHRQAKAS